MKSGTRNIGVSLRDDRGSASIEFIVFGLLVPLIALSLGMNGLGSQRHQIVCQLFAWQAVRQIAEHADEPKDEIVTRLNFLAIAKETSLSLDPGDLRFTIEGELASGSVVSVRAQLGQSAAKAAIRMP
jgi:hypothetical protein